MQKYLKYLNYLIKHKWYVMIECFTFGLIYQGIMHDISKFRPKEFFSYAEYFYGKGKNKLDFNYAWLHHQKKNKHHWQYWMLQEDSGKIVLLEMPFKYVIEMLCDWRSAGIVKTGKKSSENDRYDEVKKWFRKNERKIKIHPKTKEVIYAVLSSL
jgi:hypothetical protein